MKGAEQYILLVMAISPMACGTEVDVGRNDNPELFATDDDSGVDAVSGGASADVTASTVAPDGLALNCHEAVPEASLSVHAKAFCAEAPAEIVTPFARALARICQQRNIVRLMEEGCSWNGEKPMDGFFRVLEKTDLKDRTKQVFTMLSAFSVHVPRTPEEYLGAFYRGYEDPEFKARIKKLDAFKLSNVTVDRSAGTIDYSVQAQTSAATAKYRGHVLVKALTSGALAIYDQAVSEKVVIREQRYLILVIPTDATHSVVLAVDDKEVDDLGNHHIAYSTAVKINKDRMELTNAMANYQGDAK